ncbi:hypothetical protein AB1Y20_012059 [Prymnesium parvum]|uniref:Uncharacterized protein n=1 Tax=Prymnesium parvum TaxID=97485 RepID=A0AB34IME0_PRYPA
MALVLLPSMLLPMGGLVAHGARFQPARGSMSPLHRRPARLLPHLVMLGDDASLSYRTLGISEDASYDEIMEAWMVLSETYADDPARIGLLDQAKEKVLNDRLNARISGSLKPTVAESPWDEKPVERTPPWVIVGEYARKLFEFPTPKFALQASPLPSCPLLPPPVIGLIGGLTVASWISPNSAGTILLINVMSAMGFMYNRGQPEVKRDDFGQIGEVRPMKPKPMALTCAITFTFWMWGYLKAKRLVALAVVPRGLEVIARGTLISGSLILAALFVKPHGVFD